MGRSTKEMPNADINSEVLLQPIRSKEFNCGLAGASTNRARLIFLSFHGQLQSKLHVEQLSIARSSSLHSSPGLQTLWTWTEDDKLRPCWRGRPFAQRPSGLLRDKVSEGRRRYVFSPFMAGALHGGAC